MPHSCTSCGLSFEEGSTEMLSGCPDCGGNRFQFVPDSDDAGDTEADPHPDENLIEAEPDPAYLAAMQEDRAQSDARSSMIAPDQLPDHATSPVESETPAPERSKSPADLDELRSELEDRFESIKIVEPGKYELNLQELFERRECIIELQEHGRYAIEVPESLTDA